MSQGYQPEESYSSPILNQQMRGLVSRQLVFLNRLNCAANKWRNTTTYVASNGMLKFQKKIDE